MKMKHVHAELMALYAQDAMETDKPWEWWERKTIYDSEWNELVEHPNWMKCNQYRRKPSGKVVVIDGEEFIVPNSFKPNYGDYYYSLSAQFNQIYATKFVNDGIDAALKDCGQCYKTEGEAKQALAFWRKINAVE